MASAIAIALRAAAAVALLFNLLVGGLPRGALLSVSADGGVALRFDGCCATAGQAPGADDRTVHCCCFTGLLIGHPDQQPAPALAALDLPPAVPAVIHAWPAWLASEVEARAPCRARPLDWGPPPPLGALRPETVVIRC